MALNIIIRSKRTQKEHTIVERARGILARCYRTECEEPEKYQMQEKLPGKPTRNQIKKAWENDAKGDIDPAL